MAQLVFLITEHTALPFHDDIMHRLDKIELHIAFLSIQIETTDHTIVITRLYNMVCVNQHRSVQLLK